MRIRYIWTLFVIFIASAGATAQQGNLGDATSRPAASPTPAIKMAEKYAQIIAAIPPGKEVPQKQRAEAYAKLFEAQRMIWKATRVRSSRSSASSAQLAGEALRAAVALDPKLAEAYTALAELSLNTGTTDLDETIAFAQIAIKLEPDNFGAHRILARLFTFRSRLAGDKLDPAFVDKAIAQWKEVGRLDPRNAEAWAFLAEIYDRTGKADLHIEALRKWLSSATPIETQFYEQLLGRGSSLEPESASLKLGPALLKAGKTREAIKVLSTLVADHPDNVQAIEILRQAVTDAKSEDAGLAIEALEQASYANPSNVGLIVLLADARSKAGKVDDAVSGLNKAAKGLETSDPASAGVVLMSLGDLYAEKEKPTEAIASYEKALKVSGYDSETPPTDDGREFVMAIFEKMIRLYSIANRPDDVRSTIERARKLLGKSDLFADRQLISYYREKGDRDSALAAIRAVRTRLPADDGFLRLEATVLTELGRVDEAVKVFEDQKAKPVKIEDMPYSTSDNYSDRIFISTLYSQAGRSKEAAIAANEAYAIAKGSERKQIAKLTLASAQQNAGEFDAAETTLREILKVSPNNPIALNNLGYFFLERGVKFEEALELIKVAVSVDPTNPSYLDSLGWAYFKLGNLNEAEKHLRSALRYDPASATINEHLGDVLLKSGKLDQAKLSWERSMVLATSPEDISRIRAKISAVSK